MSDLSKESRTISIPFGNTELSFQLPAANIAWILEEEEGQPALDIPKAVLEAIEHPFGTAPLRQLLNRKPEGSILILIDDNTRATPQHVILPVLLDAMNSYGVKPEQITIMVCLGTHRPLDEQELRLRVGDEVYRQYRCINLPQNDSDFTDLGTTKAGTPIQVSSFYMAHDFKIAIGNIIPHMYAGWAGGAKMIQPGVTSSLTTARTHLLAARYISTILGNVDNPIRLEMEEIARTTGLDFIINTVINNLSEVVGLVGGDVVQAHRRGVALAEPIFTRTIGKRVPIVIAGAKPAERDLWQGFKPLNNCGLAVEDNGVLILVINAPEGISPDHQELVDLGTRTTADVLAMLERKEIQDEVAAATYMAYRATKERMSVILVTTGISAVEADKIGAYAVTTIDEALALAMELTNGKTIGIIPYGADVIIRTTVV